MWRRWRLQEQQFSMNLRSTHQCHRCRSLLCLLCSVCRMHTSTFQCGHMCFVQTLLGIPLQCIHQNSVHFSSANMQVHVRKLMQITSNGMQEIMSPTSGVPETQASRAVLQTSSRHPAELTQRTSQSATRVQQSLSDIAIEAQQQLHVPAQDQCDESLSEQASFDGDCQAYAHENLLASMEQSMDAPTACDIVKSSGSSMRLDIADSNIVNLSVPELSGSQQHANELSSCGWAMARKRSDSTAEYYSNEMELY